MEGGDAGRGPRRGKGGEPHFTRASHTHPSILRPVLDHGSRTPQHITRGQVWSPDSDRRGARAPTQRALSLSASTSAVSARSQSASLPTEAWGRVERFTSYRSNPNAPNTRSTRSRHPRISSAICSGRQKMWASSCARGGGARGAVGEGQFAGTRMTKGWEHRGAQAPGGALLLEGNSRSRHLQETTPKQAQPCGSPAGPVAHACKCWHLNKQPQQYHPPPFCAPGQQQTWVKPRTRNSPCMVPDRS